jgi:hypothetical protein
MGGVYQGLVMDVVTPVMMKVTVLGVEMAEYNTCVPENCRHSPRGKRTRVHNSQPKSPVNSRAA